MDFARLREFEEIFGHRWDALALLCLVEGPRRFNGLAASMNTLADEWLPDNVLSRSLRRLVDGKLVAKSDERGDRQGIYSLTATGVRRAGLLTQYLRHIDDGQAGAGHNAGWAEGGDRTTGLASRPDGRGAGAKGRSALPVAEGGTRLAGTGRGRQSRGAVTTMESLGQDVAREKQATVARVYDYLLGGIHNFPADQEVARRMIEQYPDTPTNARAIRQALRRAVQHLTSAGVRQFLDIGSGIPTEGNVHEIAQQAVPKARVVYVDNDPVAVAESLEILDGNAYATAIRGDLRRPADILNHPALQEMLDLRQPTALLLAAVLHFIPGEQAYQVVTDLVDPLGPGSYLFVSHATGETSQFDSDSSRPAVDEYERRTASQLALRTRAEVARFFTGLDLLEPGVVPLPEWRPKADDPDPYAAQPDRSAGLVGLAVKPSAGLAA